MHESCINGTLLGLVSMSKEVLDLLLELVNNDKKVLNLLWMLAEENLPRFFFLLKQSVSMAGANRLLGCLVDRIEECWTD